MASTPCKEDELASLLAPAFQKESFRVDRTRPLTFVCGGTNNNGIRALRYQFLDHAANPPLRIVPLLAEQTFFHQLVERNLQKFEEFLASTADCVLIFVESPGSFAETGLFAGLETVICKTFIVNTRHEAEKPSFLNTGPIKLIRNKSQFDTVFELAEKVVSASDAGGIVTRILSMYPRYEKALVFQPERQRLHILIHSQHVLQIACSYDLLARSTRIPEGNGGAGRRHWIPQPCYHI